MNFSPPFQGCQMSGLAMRKATKSRKAPANSASPPSTSRLCWRQNCAMAARWRSHSSSDTNTSRPSAARITGVRNWTTRKLAPIQTSQPMNSQPRLRESR